MAAPKETVKANSNVGHDVGLVPSHGISLDVGERSPADRPPLLKHLSSPAYESPLRHHTRHTTAPRQVKESLNAHSEYVTSQDDGTSQHRINQYIIKQEIGRGSFGAVHLGVDQYGQEYAVKEFSKSRLRKRAKSHILRGPRKPLGHLQAGQSFNIPLHRHSTEESQDELERNPLLLIKEEIAIMKKLNHPNLVSLIEVLDDPAEDSLYMVMEMCKKGVVMKVGLGDTADPYDDHSCRCWFRDLILGIEYLHHQGVLHRDIKPDNCLLTDDDVLKIVDFGVSEIFAKDSEMLTAKSAGSPAFLPPELCIVKHGGISGKAADIWSMGVTLYCLRYGRIPFDKTGIFELYESIRNDPVNLEGEKDEDFKDLMLRILEKDPSKRIEMADLRDHPWVTKRGSDPLLSTEDNIAEIVAPPTEAELNNAITGNMSNLMTVMRAVHKFKNLLARKRPLAMQSILGPGGSIVQPPLTMRRENPHLHHKSHSVETFDRRPLESALATEGVHREIDLNKPAQSVETPERKEKSDANLSQESGTSSRTASSTLAVDGPRPKAVSSPPPLTPHDSQGGGTPYKLTPTQTAGLSPDAASKPRSPPPNQPTFHDRQIHMHTMDESGHRGHAHDPLKDHLYLFIGPSTYSPANHNEDQSQPARRGSFIPDEDMPDENGPPIVSESPGAAEMDIYETAYRDEVEKIRSRTKASKTEEEPVVFLTRRVDKTIIGIGEAVGKLHAAAEVHKDKIGEGVSNLPGAANVTGLSRAFKAAAREGRTKKRSKDSVDSSVDDEVPESSKDGGQNEGRVPPVEPPKMVASPVSMEKSPAEHFHSAFDSSKSGFQGLWSKLKEKRDR